MLCVVSLHAVAGGPVAVLSDPASWNSDFRRIVPSTGDCPGGTLEGLSVRMHVEGPYSPEAYRAPDRSYIKFADGIRDDDLIHSFYCSSQSETGRYWGFGGYVVVRDGCIVHADIDGYDN